MRLAEEEKLRKEMSAKKAKEEAERKHQVCWGGAGSLDTQVPSWQLSANTVCRSSVHAICLHLCAGYLSCAGQARGLWLQSAWLQGRSREMTQDKKSEPTEPQPRVATEHLKGQSANYALSFEDSVEKKEYKNISVLLKMY